MKRSHHLAPGGKQVEEEASFILTEQGGISQSPLHTNQIASELGGAAVDTIFRVFGLTRPGLEPGLPNHTAS